MTGTTVGTSSYSFADHLSDAGKLSEAKQQAGQNIAVLTGEDYQNMESEQGALEEYKASALDRAVERHKERREWQQESAERNIENSRQFQENIKTLQEQGVTQLMSPEEIENALREGRSADYKEQCGKSGIGGSDGSDRAGVVAGCESISA